MEADPEKENDGYDEKDNGFFGNFIRTFSNIKNTLFSSKSKERRLEPDDDDIIEDESKFNSKRQGRS